MSKLQAARNVYTAAEFQVGDYVRHRTWAVPAYGQCEPRVGRKVMRIVDQIDRSGATVFVCGGGREFEAFELVPA